MGGLLSKSIFNVTKTDINAMRVEIDLKNYKDEAWFLISSDRHHDNVKCRQDLEKRHLDQALERGAGIIDLGDLHCAMQGKFDKRSSKSQIRPENMEGDYLDSLVRSAADFYKPYAKNWLSMGYGNHETAIITRHETDLTQRLAQTLNDRTGSNILALGYTGWIRFAFSIPKTRKKWARTLWFTHGYGGGGPVSQDMIQSNRQQVVYEGVDIMCSGHVHRSWMQEYIKQELNVNGEIKRKSGWYIKSPTYKDEFDKGHSGFAVEKGLGPRPLGAWWVRFYFNTVREGIEIEITKAN